MSIFFYIMNMLYGFDLFQKETYEDYERQYKDILERIKNTNPEDISTLTRLFRLKTNIEFNMKNLR